MSIDEVIAHALEVAELNEKRLDKEGNPYYEKCEKCAAKHRQLAEWLKELKQLKEQRRWIPCSERLPKVCEFVNCTCRSLIDDREDWVIETVYIPQTSGSPYSDWGNIPMLNDGKCEVIAWMHRNIPEPYKAESEEEQ